MLAGVSADISPEEWLIKKNTGDFGVNTLIKYLIIIILIYRLIRILRHNSMNEIQF